MRKITRNTGRILRHNLALDTPSFRDWGKHQGYSRRDIYLEAMHKRFGCTGSFIIYLKEVLALVPVQGRREELGASVHTRPSAVFFVVG